MALNQLSNAEMAKFSADLVRGGSSEHDALEAHPASAALIPTIEAAHEMILAAQPPSKSEIAEITEQLDVADGRHDTLVRGIEARLVSEIAFTNDAATRDALTTARNAVNPEGLSLVIESYNDEAGQAELREPRISEDVRKTLAKLKLIDDSTCADRLDELNQVARQIGELEKRRGRLVDAGAESPDGRAARSQWMGAIKALASVLKAIGVDEQPILGRIRDASAAAERAGRGTSRGSTTAAASTGASGDPAGGSSTSGSETTGATAGDGAQTDGAQGDGGQLVRSAELGPEHELLTPGGRETGCLRRPSRSRSR